MKSALEWKKYYLTPEFREKYFYNGDDLGVSCTDSGTSFKLWSPSADSVTLNLYQDGSEGEAFRRIMMSPAGSGCGAGGRKNVSTAYIMTTRL